MNEQVLTPALLRRFCHLAEGSEPDFFTGASYDSENVADGELFVSLAGDRQDLAAAQAIESGAAAVLLKPGIFSLRQVVTERECAIYVTEDLTAALKGLAAAFLKELAPAVIGVTGTDCPTEAASAAAGVLGNVFSVYWLKENEKKPEELAVTLLNTPPHCEMIILELPDSSDRGMSLLPLTYLLATGTDSSRTAAERVFSAADRMKASSVIIYDEDEPLYSRDWDKSTLSCGLTESALFFAEYVDWETDTLSFTLRGISGRFTAGGTGRANLKGALFAIAAGVHLGLSADEIQAGLRDVRQW
jgi:UDP-N-acetylmuramoyl-tripeptide--D-alanyl-D-alanine ligase